MELFGGSIVVFDKNRILALDIGARTLSLAEFGTDKGNGPLLLSYGIGNIDADPQTDADASPHIVAAIRQIMREQGMRPAPLYLSISGQAVFPRYVKLPPVTGEKVEQIIRYEAEQNVPFPIDEVVWDYQLIHEEDGELHAMLVAVKTENVARLTACVMAAGLEPEIVDVAPMALYNTLRYNYPDRPGCTMILDVGARSSNLIFCEGSRIFSRSIPVAGNAVTHEIMKEMEVGFAEAEELKLAHAFVSFGGVYAGPENETADRVSKIVRNVVTRLHAEVNRSLNFYRSQQKGQPPSLVLLTGGSSIIPHLDTFFREKLKVDVDYLNPFENISVADSVDFARLEGDVHRLGEVAGLALRHSLSCPVEINLIPPQLDAAKQFRRRLPFFALAGASAILIMLCWWVYFFRMGGMLQERVDEVSGHVQELSAIHSELQAVQSQGEAARERLDNLLGTVEMRGRWPVLVRTLHQSVLDGMWISSLRPEKDAGRMQVRAVTIEGKGFADKIGEGADGEATDSLDIVFLDRLKGSPLFTDATEVVRVRTQESLLQFTIRAVLSEPISLE